MVENGTQDVVVLAQPAGAYHARRFLGKLRAGEYTTEEVPCFCGASGGVTVAEQDRYGFPHRMLFCRKCGIIYASPRLTARSYAEFYRTEYRPIYDDGKGLDGEFRNGLIAGGNLKQLLAHFDLQPRRILDLGCGAGGWLVPFAEDGCEVLGYDLDGGAAEYARRHGLPVVNGHANGSLVGGFDLVVMNHSLEHALDLEGDLERVARLLAPEGLVFVGVPGLYTWPRESVWQNAHTYQFVAGTLAYVMECSGFEEWFADEWIASLWRYTGARRPKEQYPKREAAEVANYLFAKKRKVGLIKTTNKYAVGTRREQIREGLSYHFPDMEPLLDSRKGETAVIVGGGPSADDWADNILLMQESGARVFAIERMYGWCERHGIIPDYVVALDAHADVAAAFEAISPETVHLVASQCDHSVFDALRATGARAYVFQAPQGPIDMASMWYEAGYPSVTEVNTGGSVVICAMQIALALGMRELHVFGFDCHVTNGSYARGIAGVGEQNHTFEVEVDGKVYRTTTAYLSFAQQFHLAVQFARKTRALDRVRVYGDSLAAAMSLEDIRGEADTPGPAESRQEEATPA